MDTLHGALFDWDGVIIDSRHARAGIEAALAAGARAIAVCTTHPADGFASSGAHRIVRTLEEIEVPGLWI